jgi:hypothetical protein
VEPRRVDRYRFLSNPAVLAAAAVLLVLAVTACRQGVPVIDTSPPPPQVDGTISGTVRGPAGTSAVSGRQVTVVNVRTGERLSTTTSSTGGFTFKVKPGRYRVELALLPGEIIEKRPSEIDVNASDVDAFADFVLGSGRLTRPRLPRLRVDHGLGAPSA